MVAGLMLDKAGAYTLQLSGDALQPIPAWPCRCRRAANHLPPEAGGRQLHAAGRRERPDPGKLEQLRGHRRPVGTVALESTPPDGICQPGAGRHQRRRRRRVRQSRRRRDRSIAAHAPGTLTAGASSAMSIARKTTFRGLVLETASPRSPPTAVPRARLHVPINIKSAAPGR